MFDYGVGATKSGVQAAMHAPCAALQAAAAAIVEVGVDVSHAHHPTVSCDCSAYRCCPKSEAR